MSIRNSSGTVMTKTALKAALSSSTVTYYTVPAETYYYQAVEIDGEASFETGRRLLFRPGQVFTSAEIDAYYPTATFVSVAPTGGTTSGGTDVVITGTNLAGVTNVTFGGHNATSIVVVSNTEITCKTPADDAGAKDIVLIDDNANVTATGAYTYS